jgi:uncharacterized protein (TIGR03437 family)
MDAPVQLANPAIFLGEASGDGSFAAAVNQDGTINSKLNPAPVGSVVSIFATGLGALINAPPDGSVIGLPPPSLAVDVQVLTETSPLIKPPLQFATVKILYAGPAPNEIEGLTQINIEVPASPRLYLFVAPKTSGRVITTTDSVTFWVGP